MSNFKPWIDDKTSNKNIQSSTIYENDSQRKKGFQAGTSASSVRMNTVLRQVSLVVAALMDNVGNNSLDASSTVEAIQTALTGYLTTFQTKLARYALKLTVPDASSSTVYTEVTWRKGAKNEEIAELFNNAKMSNYVWSRSIDGLSAYDVVNAYASYDQITGRWSWSVYAGGQLYSGLSCTITTIYSEN